MMDINRPSNYVCRFCKCSFSQVLYLHKHVQQVHTAGPVTKSSRTCPICGLIFGAGGTNESYKTHLRHIHGQRDEGQVFTFKCFNDFFLWKTELEKRTSCKYVLQSAPKVLPTSEKIHVYQCDQSLNKKKKCNIAIISNSKCPAMICATESMKNLEIKIDYWNTHVGHSVQVEEDELNAAISSVQSDESHAEVMDMLNNIGQNVETTAEEYVTASFNENMPSTSFSRNVQKNMLTVKKRKPPTINLSPSSPVVPNFSFKKDPSKKKESSIYSLASVACGKVSANKVNINKSASAQFQDLVKNITKKNSGTLIDKKATESRFKAKEIDSDKTNDSFNNDFSFDDIDTVPDSSKQVSNHSSSMGGRFVPINPMPANRSSSAELNISKESDSSETLTTKSMSDKENVSLVSNKNKPLSKTASRSLLKSNKNPDTSAAKNGKLSQNLKPQGVISTDMPQIILASVPQPNLNSIISGKQIGSLSAIPQSSTSTSQVASPMTQTYLSIDNKLIPVMNVPPGTPLNPNLGSGIILSPASLPTLTSSISTSIASGLFPSSKPLPAGATGKGLQAQNASPFTASFPNAPVVLVPYANSSTLPPGLKPLTVPSPAVMSAMRPMTPLPINSIISNLPDNLGQTAKSLTVIPGKPGSSLPTVVVSSEKPGLSKLGKSLLNAAATNALQVRNASLPLSDSICTPTTNTNVVATAESILKYVSSNSTSVTSTPTVINPLTGSKLGISQSLVKKDLTNFKPSTPNLNISKIFESKNHKPGTFVFESSGELFMLEPVDDELVVKNTTPITSTPKKTSEALKAVADYTPKTSQSVKRRMDSPEEKAKKFKPDNGNKPDETKKVVCSHKTTNKSVVYDASTKSAYVVDNVTFSDSSDENSNSCLSGVSNYSHKVSDVSTNSKSESVFSTTNTKNAISESSIAKDSANAQNKTLASIAISHSEVSKKNEHLKSPLSENKSKVKHSPFTNLFPVKSPSSILTVKTVPSLAMHQSKPMSSFINSTRTQSSNSILTTSSQNCISSIQSTGSATEPTTPQPKNTPVTICDSELKNTTTENSSEKQSEVKRGVTIKSVVQEKRCITDSDLEIMKKVKFYKLEMQYYSCQEECKKLKIELIKALSKNKELMQVIEDLKKNENSVKENDDLKTMSSTNECVTDKKNEDINSLATMDSTSTEEENLKENKTFEICPENKNDLPKQNMTDSVVAPNKDDLISDKKNIDVSSENSNKPASVSVSDMVLPIEDIEMIDVSDESKDCGEKDALKSDTTIVPDKADTIFGKEIMLISDESSDSVKAKDTQILNTIEASDTVNISPVKEVIDLLDESCDGDIARDVSAPDTVDIIFDQEIIEPLHETSDDTNEKDVCLEDIKQNKSGENESSKDPGLEVVSNESDNSKADVYTMVRTSVLRNLYLDIDDLCREKRKLLEDMEHLKKLQPKFVPSFE